MIMQKARGNHCIEKILTDIPSISVVQENCCKPIVTIENKEREREREREYIGL
jgi:hypothetical protein